MGCRFAQDSAALSKTWLPPRGAVCTGGRANVRNVLFMVLDRAAPHGLCWRSQNPLVLSSRGVCFGDSGEARPAPTGPFRQRYHVGVGRCLGISDTVLSRTAPSGPARVLDKAAPVGPVRLSGHPASWARRHLRACPLSWARRHLRACPLPDPHCVGRASRGHYQPTSPTESSRACPQYVGGSALEPGLEGGLRPTGRCWKGQESGSGGVYAEVVSDSQCHRAGPKALGGCNQIGGGGLTFNTAAIGSNRLLASRARPLSSSKRHLSGQTASLTISGVGCLMDSRAKQKFGTAKREFCPQKIHFNPRAGFYPLERKTRRRVFRRFS